MYHNCWPSCIAGIWPRNLDSAACFPIKAVPIKGFRWFFLKKNSVLPERERVTNVTLPSKWCAKWGEAWRKAQYKMIFHCWLPSMCFAGNVASVRCAGNVLRSEAADKYFSHCYWVPSNDAGKELYRVRPNFAIPSIFLRWAIFLGKSHTQELLPYCCIAMFSVVITASSAGAGDMLQNLCPF